jgi:PBP1b-binding outer membrane lipoprotein LpoB
MCYASVNGQSSVSSGGFVDWLLTVVSVVLLILLLAGCMTIKNAQLEVKNEGGTVNVMTKTVTVPTNVTVPATALGF